MHACDDSRQRGGEVRLPEGLSQMNKGEYYWINLVNMVEIKGPFRTAKEAVADAKGDFTDPPDNGKDNYTVGIGILKVESTGEVVVKTKSEWVDDAEKPVVG